MSKFCVGDIIDTNYMNGWWVGKIMQKVGPKYLIYFQYLMEEILFPLYMLMIPRMRNDVWVYSKNQYAFLLLSLGFCWHLLVMFVSKKFVWICFVMHMFLIGYDFVLKNKPKPFWFTSWLSKTICIVSGSYLG